VTRYVSGCRFTQNGIRYIRFGRNKAIRLGTVKELPTRSDVERAAQTHVNRYNGTIPEQTKQESMDVDPASVRLERDADGLWIIHYRVCGLNQCAAVGMFDTEDEAQRASAPIVKRLACGEWSCLDQEPTGNSWNRIQYTAEEYQIQLVKQGGKCAICGKEPARLHWDHDHITDARRELLCPHCNRAIGMLRDDPQRCESAAAYLRRFGK
jgi:DNA-directed RNA polymerase subunit RPC12/RpoP